MAQNMVNKEVFETTNKNLCIHYAVLNFARTLINSFYTRKNSIITAAKIVSCWYTFAEQTRKGMCSGLTHQ
jgi:hypothetical protein